MTVMAAAYMGFAAMLADLQVISFSNASASVGVPIFCKPKHPGRERRRLVSDQRQQCNLPPTLVQVYKKEDGLAQE